MKVPAHGKEDALERGNLTRAKDIRAAKNIAPIANRSGPMWNIDHAPIIGVLNVGHPTNATNADGTRKRRRAERSC